MKIRNLLKTCALVLTMGASLCMGQSQFSGGGAGAKISGTPSAGNCASWANSTTLQDAGAACGSGTSAIGSLTGATQYWPLFGTSTAVGVAPTSMVTNADSGADLCTREYNVAPKQNGGNNYEIIDARGETVNGSASVFNTCALNPIGVNIAFSSLFPTANSNGNGDHYLQPPGIIQTSIPWNLGDNQITDEGVNSGTSTGSGTTLGAPSMLQATATITSNQGTGETYTNGVYAVGLVAGTVRNGVGPYRSKLIGRNIDCFGQSIFGLTWYSGQEGTKGNNLSVNDCLIAAIRWGYSNSIGDGSDLHDFTASHSSVNQANKRGVNSCIINSTAMGATGGLSWTVDTTGHVVFTYTNTPDVLPLPGYYVVFSGLATGGSHGTNICPSTGICAYTIGAVSTSASGNSGNWDDERWCPTGLPDSPSGCTNTANQFSGLKQFGISIPAPGVTDTSSATQGTATLFTTQMQMNGFLGRETSDATIDALNCVNASPADLLVSGIQGSGRVTNIHNEGDGTASPTTIGLLIGVDSKTSGWEFDNIQGSTAIGTGVYISDEWGAPTNLNFNQICGLISGKVNIQDIHNGVTLNRNSSTCVNYFIDGSGNYPFTNGNSTDLASSGQAIDIYNGVLAGYNTGQQFSLNASNGVITGKQFSGNPIVIEPSADSTSSIQIKTSGGSVIATFDTSTVNGRLGVASASVPGAAFDVASGKFQVNINGTCPKIGNTTTGGLTGCVADFTSSGDQTALGADLAATTILATGASGAATYVVDLYVAVTRAGTTSSVMPSACVLWTDRDTSSTLQELLTVSSNANSTSTYSHNTIQIDAKASTNVQIASGANCTGGTTFASVGATTMQYKIRAKVTAN